MLGSLDDAPTKVILDYDGGRTRMHPLPWVEQFDHDREEPKL